MVTGGAGEDEVSWGPSSDRGTLSAGRGEDEVSWSPSSHDRAFAAVLPVIASVLLLVPGFRCGHCNDLGLVWFWQSPFFQVACVVK